MKEYDVAAKHASKPSEAPLAEGDVPEQDGSEDPGVGLELNRDAELLSEKKRAQNTSQQEGATSPSPSAAEHLNIRGGLNIPKGQQAAGKTNTEGIGEGATVSHVDGSGT
jgi:hypothetical protein